MYFSRFYQNWHIFTIYSIPCVKSSKYMCSTEERDRPISAKHISRLSIGFPRDRQLNHLFAAKSQSVFCDTERYNEHMYYFVYLTLCCSSKQYLDSHVCSIVLQLDWMLLQKHICVPVILSFVNYIPSQYHKKKYVQCSRLHSLSIYIMRSSKNFSSQSIYLLESNILSLNRSLNM